MRPKRLNYSWGTGSRHIPVCVTKARAALAVRKGNGELLGKINAALATLEADGTLKSIFNKYGLDDWAPPK